MRLCVIAGIVFCEQAPSLDPSQRQLPVALCRTQGGHLLCRLRLAITAVSKKAVQMSSNSANRGSLHLTPTGMVVDDELSCRVPSPLPGTTRGPVLTAAPSVDSISQRHSTRNSGVLHNDEGEVFIASIPDLAKLLADSGKDLLNPTMDTIELTKVLAELGYKGNIQFKVVKDTTYAILYGRDGLRSGRFWLAQLKGTKYLADNVHVAKLLVGDAKLLASGAKGTLWTIAFTVTADVLEAVLSDDELMRSRLGTTITVNISKAAISGVIGTTIAMVIAGTTAPAWIPIAAGIGIGIAVGKGLDWAFPTLEIVEWIEHVTRQSTWERWLYELESGIYHLYGVPRW